MSKVFDLVLGVFREPGLVADLREKELPESLSLVIRLAAGEGAALQCALDTTGETEETLVDASVFFLQQVLFAPGADAYRVLGADSDAPQERLRDNYRWLMKWLHPDRNQDGWEAVYADRVNVAWQDLKTPDRRAEYDRRMPSSQMLAPMTAAPMRRVAPPAATPGGPLLSGSAVRRLPTLVLGTLGVAAAAMIGLTWWAQSATQRELSELQRGRDAPADRGSARQDESPRDTATTADAAGATSAAAAAVRADLDAIDVVFADAAPLAPVPVPEAPAAVPAAAVDVAVESAALVSPATQPLMVAAAEPAPLESDSEPLAVPVVSVPPMATAPAAPIAAAAEPVAVSAPPAVAAVEPPAAAEPTPAAIDVATATGQAAAIARVEPAAATIPAPAKPMPAAVAPALAAPASDMASAQVPAPAVIRRPLPAQAPAPAPPVPPAPAQPALAATEKAADRPGVAPKPDTVIAARPPAAAVAPPQPIARAAPALPPVATARVEAPVPAATLVESPTSAVAAAAPPGPAPAQHDAEALVREFASAYAAGDLARFDRLFASASPQPAALLPMRSRFGTTEMRYLEIQQIGWQAEAEQGRVRARFRDTYVPRGARKAITESGVIEWTIRVDAGDARIASVDRNNAGT